MSIPHRVPGLVLTDHEFEVPLDHDAPGGETIRVFAREVVAPGKEHADLPWMVYLQGGPGFEAPRPTGASGWVKRALKDHRLLLLDQRGTGRSTLVHAASVVRRGTPEAQAAYLALFRQEQIIRDCEFIRARLAKGNRWKVLGQSWGGFLATAYLSRAPEGLSAALITGGVPPLATPIDDIYRATYRRVLRRNQRYFERYPADRAAVDEIGRRLGAEDVRLPNGDRLSVRRFQQLGMAFGMSDGFETIHALIESAFDGGEWNPAFLIDVDRQQSFTRNPIFAILHEPIYAQGSAPNWSAERIRPEYPEFDCPAPLFFTGEMIYPWMFDDYQALTPMKAAAHLLAAKRDWPVVYDPGTLSRNQVPTAACVYLDDMYVEWAYSEETARAIPGFRLWATNEYDHNGLRADGEKILDRLLGMVSGEV
ncbi:MAG: alpha/beta fold hydrolase [Candidatus Eisenbacteria bacterium]|nr:alpha/beta fold hydrolase [Candidatus Eisenbacteria bacterium]